ncbi:DUF484 family protein [Lampropedia puyangensis]|uniref:DUF484 family protein n=1 Tax=Lampropedia puyangensis TaxID=1330072 RepID=A0A4S8FC29_9BURK|nr:DUF484 family protein [Lampropedia puyangensis]THU04094.1 DUF484 family protein [Lampropedia puyangensis]
MTNLPAHQAGLTTEEDIASYLISNPEFFERFAEVLGTVQLASPHGGKTVSLHERQTSMLREKIKGLEATIVEMMGYGSENMQIIEKAHAWTQAMLKERDPQQLPTVLTAQLQVLFDVPNVYLRLWDLDAVFTQLPEVQMVSAESKGHIAALAAPYCGPRGSVEGLKSLAGDGANLADVQSIAILPLRAGAIDENRITFGYLLLTSPDSHRFKHEMGTDLLVRLATLASASMQRLLPSETIVWLKEQERLSRQQDGQAELPLD